MISMFSFLLRFSLILSVGMWPSNKPAAHSSTPIKKSSYDLPVQSHQYDYIKILILNGASEVTIAAPGPYRILDDKGNAVYKAKSLASSHVKTKGEIIQIGMRAFQSNPVAIISEDGQGVKIKGAWYRHGLEIWREANGKLTVINDIPIEDYLKGVLPSEVNPHWPMESLKAQAIASRTYALFKMIENQSQRYHLSKDVLSQVYGGKNLEHSLTTQAVEMTHGQILTYSGKIFPAYFHSTCGGHTTHAEYIWPIEPHPSLAGVECNFCWKSKHYRWEAEVSTREMEKKLKAHGVKVSNVRDIRIEEKDETGRARYFIVDTTEGPVKMHSNDFRIWVDPMKFKSTWIHLTEKTSSGFSFKGRGWGHGAGLCQFGAKQLGEMGYTADRILYYYYPGSEITQYWTEPPKSIENSFKSFLTRIKAKLDLE